MEKRLTFNKDAENYDKWRPKYCTDLFDKIISYSQLDSEKKTVEIGPGTGQATEPFLKTGCNMVAVEPGENLTNFVENKFNKYKNFTVHNIQFEEFNCSQNSIDLVYSATAFHWIPEDIGYRKIYDMLKSGGTIALFWNRPAINRSQVQLHNKLQEIYKKYRPESKPTTKDYEAKYNKISDAIKSCGFTDFELHLYNKSRVFNADDYISLLNTYSDHIIMPQQDKINFEKEIKLLINEFGSINIHDTIDLHLAKKP